MKIIARRLALSAFTLSLSAFGLNAFASNTATTNSQQDFMECFGQALAACVDMGEQKNQNTSTEPDFQEVMACVMEKMKECM